MIITQTPLRISFVGGGPDLPSFYHLEGGAVVSTTIDKYVYVIAKERFDDQIRVGYTQTEITGSIDEVKHDLVREALRKTGVNDGLEIVTVGDIPSEGTGLGSSSSVTVGLLNALYQYRGEPKEPRTLAELACDIEIKVLGKPIGKQDQYIAALGGLRKTVFHPDEEVSSEPINIPEKTLRALSRSLLLFYTGVTRSADPILKEQQANTSRRMETLRRMKEMATELEQELINGNIEALGEMLHHGWCYKRELASGITNPTIDEVYEAARRGGAMGGKITGAGGGGFLLLYAPVDLQERVRRAIDGLREVPFSLERDGTKTLLNARRPV